MPAKPEASHKAERDAASFEKFNATFFEGFLWSGDETVKVDTAKLIELFERCFKSKDYPTLNELRETVSFLHSLVLLRQLYLNSNHTQVNQETQKYHDISMRLL